MRIGDSGAVATGYSITLSAAPALPQDSAAGLTPTQWQVVEGVAEGQSDREIAERLHLSVHTVHERVAALHEICGTRSRPQLVAALVAARAG